MKTPFYRKKGHVGMEELKKLTGKQIIDYFTNKIVEERNIPKFQSCWHGK